MTIEYYIGLKDKDIFCTKQLLKLFSCTRDESDLTNLEEAFKDVPKLRKSDSTNDKCIVFSEIFGARNFHQLKLVCEAYYRQTGKTIDKKIKSDFPYVYQVSNTYKVGIAHILFKFLFQQGFLSISRYAIDKHEFYARQLHKTMAGLGTDDLELMRLIVTRSEIDLEDIKLCFLSLYGKSLKSWVKGDTSGKYREALYVLIADEVSFSTSRLNFCRLI